MRVALAFALLLSACSASKGLHDLVGSVDCALGCALANATGRCGDAGCEIASCHAGFGDCNGQPQDGCEVDLDSDPKHCALCANACDTGTCHQGSCHDLNVVASTTDLTQSVVDFVVDGESVYFVRGNLVGLIGIGSSVSNTVSLQVVPRAGGEPSSLAVASGITGKLAAGADRIAWLVQEAAPTLADGGTDPPDSGTEPTIVSPFRLLSIPKAGGDATPLASGNDPVLRLEVLGSSVYWLTGGLIGLASGASTELGVTVNYHADQAFYRVPIAGGTSENLASFPQEQSVSLLAADSGVLLWRKDAVVEVADAGLGLAVGGLYGFEPESRTETLILPTLCWACPIAMTEGNVYWTDVTTSAVQFVPLGGGAATTVWQPAAATLWKSDTPVNGHDVAVTPRFVFLLLTVYRPIGAGDFNGILRIDRSTGQQALVVTRGQAPLSHLAVDGEYVYWLESGQLVRTAQSG